jgi:hypothetical protein
MDEKLKQEHEQYIALLRAAGDPITTYQTPCCGKAVECRAGVSGEVWDTLTTCVHCGALHVRVTGPDGVTGVVPSERKETE